MFKTTWAVACACLLSGCYIETYENGGDTQEPDGTHDSCGASHGASGCIESSECKAGETCSPSGSCEPAPTEPSCVANEQCAAGSYCDAKTAECTSSAVCQKEADCPDGFNCDATLSTCLPAASPTCGELATEADCLARAECEPIYAGVDCSCGADCSCKGGEPGCVCQSFEFFRCVPLAQ